MAKTPNELRWYTRLGFVLVAGSALIGIFGFIYGKADAASIFALEDKMHKMEVNDAVQTQILKSIEIQLDKIEKKIDKLK